MATRVYTPSKKERFDRSDLFWLAYLIFFVIEPVQRRSAIYWVECLAIMAVFVVMYVVYFRTTSRPLQWALASGMVVLGMACMPFNGGGTAFIIYAAALFPFCNAPAGWVFLATISEALIVLVEEHYLHFGLFSIFINVFFTVVVGITNLFFAQKLRSDEKLHLQAEEIEALAAVAERERIARDLHDVLGHTLSVIVLKSELAHRLLQRELSAETLSSENLQDLRRACREIADVERTSRTALAEVREAIGGYRARGLAAEVEAARETLATAGVTLSAAGQLTPATLSAAEETVLALALREAVTNIVRHAQATTCTLQLVCEHGHHRLSVQDNGQHGSVLREGNGLRGMRERVEALGGELSLTREQGTRLRIELPVRVT